MTASLLICEDLVIGYGGDAPVVNKASFTIARGECLALVGQSGSGKTSIARAILGILPDASRVSGTVRLDGRDLLGKSETALRKLRGLQVGYVAQDPYQACDPLRPVHDHVVDAWQVHGLAAPEGVALQRLHKSGIPLAEQAIWDFPHAWSGGMLQRASIVAACAHNPPLIVADEPTSAIDAERSDATIGALKASGAAMLLISHDLRLVLRHADRIAVCHDGRIIEIGTADTIATAPVEDYTKQFVAAAQAVNLSRVRDDVLGAPIISARQLAKHYARGRTEHIAIEHADLDIRASEIVGVSGPSGCGKSTLLRLLGDIERPTSGTIDYAPALTRPGAIMPIFQDPVAILDARWPIWRSIVEPMLAQPGTDRDRTALRRSVQALLRRVGLSHIDIDSLPSELSTGQCQRICIARAIIAKPRLIIADEPTSALDTLSTAAVLDLLEIAAGDGTAIFMISHDRPLLDAFCHRVLDMRAGVLQQSCAPISAIPLVDANSCC
jgi:peptide/nickel transport system ATP-binding protein